jgi:undecaprenyl-diphosphatase
MIQHIVLGVIQGITEWLPVSSEAVIVLVMTHWFDMSLFEAVKSALFLHLGTLLAAIIYFWSDIKRLFRMLGEQRWRSNEEFMFYAIATVVSVVIAGGATLILQGLDHALDGSNFSMGLITIIIGALLLMTAFLQWLGGHFKGNPRRTVTQRDAWLAGLGQGLAAFPGISRSGTTTALLLLQRLDAKEALRASFIMSIPFVLIGNIALNLTSAAWTWAGLVSLAVACLIGLASIHLFLKIVEKLNFALVVFVFGLLVVASGIWLV